VPMPYSKPLEDIAYPHEPQIVSAALSVLGRDRAGAPTPQAATTHDGEREAGKDAPGAVQEAMQQAGATPSPSAHASRREA